MAGGEAPPLGSECRDPCRPVCAHSPSWPRLALVPASPRGTLVVTPHQTHGLLSLSKRQRYRGLPRAQTVLHLPSLGVPLKCPKDTERRRWHPTPVPLAGKSHGRRSLVGCSPWSLEESDMAERFHFHFSLSCIGEGNGNPLQCSCLENPSNRGAWWAAIYGITQSRTRLKRLSSSSSSSHGS